MPNRIMFKPVELLVITAVSFGAAVLHKTPAASVGIRPAGFMPMAGSVATIVAAQTALAAGLARERTSADCGLQGARDRGRAMNCS